MWKCADPELEQQIRCFPYRAHSDVPRLQQVKQKAVGRQRNLGLRPALAELVDQWLTMRKVPLSNPILDIAFFGS